MSIKTMSSRVVYRNPWISVREDVIERSNGVQGIYGVVDKDPACIVIALDHTPEGDFLYLIEQFRYTVQGTYKEFPQGGWEQADVDVEELARGELREETGLSAGRLTKLGMHWIAYGRHAPGTPRLSRRRPHPGRDRSGPGRTRPGRLPGFRRGVRGDAPGRPGCATTAPPQPGAFTWSGDADRKPPKPPRAQRHTPRGVGAAHDEGAHAVACFSVLSHSPERSSR